MCSSNSDLLYFSTFGTKFYRNPHITSAASHQTFPLIFSDRSCSDRFNYKGMLHSWRNLLRQPRTRSSDLNNKAATSRSRHREVFCAKSWYGDSWAGQAVCGFDRWDCAHFLFSALSVFCFLLFFFSSRVQLSGNFYKQWWGVHSIRSLVQEN